MNIIYSTSFVHFSFGFQLNFIVECLENCDIVVPNCYTNLLFVYLDSKQTEIRPTVRKKAIDKKTASTEIGLYSIRSTIAPSLSDIICRHRIDFIFVYSVMQKTAKQN